MSNSRDYRDRTEYRRRREREPFRISWVMLLFGLGLGAALGLVYAWQIDPLEEYNTHPWQLEDDALEDYLVAISLAYRADGDLITAAERLVELRLGGDAFQVLADTACVMFRRGIETESQQSAIEAMIALYEPQGRTACADQSPLFAANPVTPTPFPTAIPATPTLTPAASKTATPFSPLEVTPPTAAPALTPGVVIGVGDFAIMQIPTFCSIEQAGVIEVYVELPGTGSVPGVPVRVTWDGGEDIFYTGLQPEQGAGFADFKMEANRTYFVEIPDGSDRTTGLTATPCTTAEGQRSTTSYRVIFRRL